MKKQHTNSAEGDLKEITLIGVESLDRPKENIKVYGTYVYNSLLLPGMFEVVKTRLNKAQIKNYNSLSGVVITSLN